MKTKAIQGFTTLLAISFVLISISTLFYWNNVITAQSPQNPVCWDSIINGSFEDDTGWTTPVTEYQAGYSTALAYIGQRSMRTGITNPQHNRFSYSSALQTVTLPENATDAVLSFRLYPMSNEPTHLKLPENPLGLEKKDAGSSGDAQLVLILDMENNELERLVMMRSNEQSWLGYSFDVSHYAGETIKVYFDTLNNGWGGITSMFVDNVSLGNCPEIIPTATATATSTPSPTATSTPAGQSHFPIVFNEYQFCRRQLILNRSFEDDAAWDIPLTEYPAAYSLDQAQDGMRSMRTGIIDSIDNQFSYSSTRQEVEVPADIVRATLSFWLYQTSTEPTNLSLPSSALGMTQESAGSSGDAQFVLILDTNDTEIERLMMEREDHQAWVRYSFDLTKYAGQTIQLYFGVYNNGMDGITSMYVDDTSLSACDPILPTMTPTPSPTPTATATSTPLPGIFGKVSEQGVAVPDVLLTLLFYDGSEWLTVANTTTNDEGNYLFPGTNPLNPGEIYQVSFGPNTTNTSRVRGWLGPQLLTYTSGENMNGGDFDIANVNLLKPISGATVSLPITFEWQPRNLAGDSYRLYIFDPATEDWWWTEDLGYVGKVTINNFPPEISFNKAYGWRVYVFAEPDSYGYSFFYNDVTFSPSSTNIEQGSTIKWDN